MKWFRRGSRGLNVTGCCLAAYRGTISSRSISSGCFTGHWTEQKLFQPFDLVCYILQLLFAGFILKVGVNTLHLVFVQASIDTFLHVLGFFAKLDLIFGYLAFIQFIAEYLGLTLVESRTGFFQCFCSNFSFRWSRWLTANKAQYQYTFCRLTGLATSRVYTLLTGISHGMTNWTCPDLDPFENQHANNQGADAWNKKY